MRDPVEYRVSLASRRRHVYEVEARFPTGGRGAIELRLPVWTPGSYLIREYERHLADLVALDEDGRALPVRKLAKSCWRVECVGAAAVRARYRVYAREVTVRTNHLDDTHAYWNGAPLFLYDEVLRAAPVRVEIDDLPPGWRIDSALASDPARAHVLTADDHDQLCDSPVEIGTHERLDFTACGRPHAIAIWGRARFDRQRLVDDVRAIIEAQTAVFGDPPYERYTFILHLVPGGYGGLEHKASCSILAAPAAFSTRKRYGDLLELVSHEFLHLWNGKRIRPAALGPFDYQGECYTRSLWVVEGWTSYYDRLFLRRAGRIDAARYREKLAEDIGRLLRTPGRFQHSLEDASFDAWIKHYRPDENNVNTTVSYYLKGSIVALLLDLAIRNRTGGRRSLDDALRLLWRETQRTGAGYADDALQGLVEEASGVGLDDVFAGAVRGRADPDFDAALGTVGLRLERKAEPAEDERDGAWLGANLKADGSRLRVTESLADGPAQRAGLQPGDEIIAWEGLRVDEEGVRDRLRAAATDEEVRLTLFRRDELRELSVTLGKRPLDQVEVVADPAAGDEAKAAYAAWLGEEWRPPPA